METMKEERQSSNEELERMTAELSRHTEELCKPGWFLSAVLVSVGGTLDGKSDSENMVLIDAHNRTGK